MKTPIIILMVLWAINLLTVAYLHGKEKLTTHNIFHTIIAQSINIGLFYWAGLFDQSLNQNKMNQHRMMRVIKLMQFLKVKPRPIHSMARYLGISTRSVYRYLKMYEAIGYDVQKDDNYKYYINETL